MLFLVIKSTHFDYILLVRGLKEISVLLELSLLTTLDTSFVDTFEGILF